MDGWGSSNQGVSDAARGEGGTCACCTCVYVGLETFFYGDLYVDGEKEKGKGTMRIVHDELYGNLVSLATEKGRYNGDASEREREKEREGG